MVYLRAKGIYNLGTARINRVPNCKIPNDITNRKQPRVFSTEYVGSSYNIDITNVLWKDNKTISLLSTYVGVKPFLKLNANEGIEKIARYDRKSKRHIEVDCPQIIREYNAHMGGVDLMDGLMGRYHIRAKTRDAMTRIFYHLVDMAASNAYVLYRRIKKENMSTDKLLELPEFRESIAADLVTYQSKHKCGPFRDYDRKFSSLSSQRTAQPGWTMQSPSTPKSSKPSLTVGEKSKHPISDIRFYLLFSCLDESK